MAYGSGQSLQVNYTSEPTPGQPRKPGELSDLVSRLGEGVSEIEMHAGRIAGALDRIHGSRPAEAQAGKTPTVASNALSDLRDKLDRLQRLSAWLNDSAQRLESIA